MANVKISGITATTSPVAADLMEIELATGGTSKSLTLGNLITKLHQGFKATISAGAGAQTLTDSTAAIMTFDTVSGGSNEEFEQPSNTFTAGSTYKWTPTVAGYYFVHAALQSSSTVADNAYLEARIYLTGTHVSSARVENETGGAQDFIQARVSDIVYCDGTNDYIQCYGYYYDNGLGGTLTIARDPKLTYFLAYRVC